MIASCFLISVQRREAGQVVLGPGMVSGHVLACSQQGRADGRYYGYYSNVSRAMCRAENEKRPVQTTRFPVSWHRNFQTGPVGETGPG
jgi:hypothetical protein